MTIDYKYFTKKIIALNRHPDFDSMASVYTKDDLFATYWALTLDGAKVRTILKQLRLSLDELTSFNRVMAIISEKYNDSNKDNPRLLRYLHKMYPDSKQIIDTANMLEVGLFSKIEMQANTPQLTPEILADRYLVQNKSLQDIANEFNCTRQNVLHFMNRHSIERRSRGKARVEAIKQGKFGDAVEYHDINESFFTEWSDSMAWVLGLIYTDGCLHHGKTSWVVTIDNNDIELIEKPYALMNSTKKAYKRQQSYDKSKHIYVLQISREKMIYDLKRIGLVERKSLTMQFPLMPEPYVRHFIRGCWDGDGSFYTSNGVFTASYVCGSLPFIKELNRKLFENGIHKTVANKTTPITIHKRHDKATYDFKFTRHDHIEKFFHYLYDGVGANMYLTRKYNKISDALKNISRLIETTRHEEPQAEG